MIVDGWNYDMSAAPRVKRGIGSKTIVAVAREDDHWTRWGLASEAVAVFWDSGIYNDGVLHEDNIGWTTGGCNRYPDEAFVCWRLMPERRA